MLEMYNKIWFESYIDFFLNIYQNINYIQAKKHGINVKEI